LRNLELIIPEFAIPKFTISQFPIPEFPDYLQQFMVPRNVAENTLRRGFAPKE
jgi:hypothetical protein